MTTLSPKTRKALHKVGKMIVRDMREPDYLAQRARLAARIAELAEDGRVAIVHGGMDCDGGRWDGHVTVIPATVVAFNHWLDEQHHWADGPRWQHLERPSVAATVEAESRDIGLEAFENGHPHSWHL